MARLLRWTPSTGATTAAVIFVGLFLVTVTRQTGFFQSDTQNYWDATRSLLGILPTPPEFWELRGVLTAIVFLPAALASTVLGPSNENLTVLVQNSFVIAAVGAYLLPAVIRLWSTPTLAVRVAAAGLLWFTTAHFSPYSLIDLYAAFGLLAAIPLLVRGGPWRLAAAGVLVGVVLNLRPAYVVVAAFILVATIVARRAWALALVAGVVVALVPQLVLNIAMFDTASFTAVDSEGLAQLQAGYASYTVRYDTVLGDTSARQFYCSPWMATSVGSSPPESVGQLALVLLGALPGSALFALQKVGASLHWPVNIPYSTPTAGVDSFNGIVVTAITVIGIALIARRLLTRDAADGRRDWTTFSMLMSVVVGTMLAIVASASEARFALAAVLIGVLGLASLPGPEMGGARQSTRWWIITAVILAAVIVLGLTGLDHPAPRGEATATTCAAA